MACFQRALVAQTSSIQCCDPNLVALKAVPDEEVVLGTLSPRYYPLIHPFTPPVSIITLSQLHYALN